MRCKVVKNKIAPPFQQAEFDIMFNEGISWSGDLLDLAVIEGICQKSGAWFSWGDVRMGQGRETAKQFLRDNPEAAAEIREKVLAARGVLPESEAEVEAAAEARDATVEVGVLRWHRIE